MSAQDINDSKPWAVAEFSEIENERFFSIDMEEIGARSWITICMVSLQTKQKNL